MNRKAIAKRLENLSKIFNPDTPFCRDLKAMSYVINNMSDEKFRTIIKEELKDLIDFEEDDDADEREEESVKMVLDRDIDESKDEDKDEDAIYSYWTTEASDKVQEILLREIVGMDKEICCDTGRRLSDEQIPDGTHKGLPEKPDTLTNKQTPDISKSINSKMVEKVKKEEIRKDAAKKCKTSKEEEELKEKVEKTEIEKDMKKGKKEEKKEEGKDTSSIVEGVELLASMNEFELSPSEIDELSNLFK